MKPARLVLPLLLLAILAVAWILRPADVDVPAGEEVGGAIDGASRAPPVVVLPPDDDEEAHLEGLPDAKPPLIRPWGRGGTVPPRRPVPRLRIHGSVRDGAGRPLHRALVYQLSRKSAAGTGWTRARGETGADGQFAFQGWPLGNSWVCVRMAGYRTVFLDGLQVTRDGEVQFVLEETPALSVRFVDAAGEPCHGCGVRVVPVGRAGPDTVYPGPASPVPEQFDLSNAHGYATFHFEAPGPVMVIPMLEGEIAVPREQFVPDAAGTWTFEVVRAGGIEVKAVDEGGRRVAESLWVSVLEPETGEVLAHYRGSEKDGALEAEPPVPPGRYHLDISARGYEPTVLPDVGLPPGPAILKRTVTLKLLAKSAVLRIVLPAEGEAVRKAVRGTGFSLLLRRNDPGWKDLGWRVRDDYRWDADTSSLRIGLRPGTWEAVISRLRDDAVATLGPVTLAAGGKAERRAALTAGVSFSLYDVLPPGLAVRAVRFRVPGYGAFPPIGSWFSTTLGDAGGLLGTIDPPGSNARRAEGGGALLGPYPGSHLVLKVDDWSGRTHRFTVGR